MMEHETAYHYSEWIQKHPAMLAQHAGHWIALLDDEIIASGEDALKIYNSVKKKYPRKIPFLYKVPRADEGPYVL